MHFRMNACKQSLEVNIYEKQWRPLQPPDNIIALTLPSLNAFCSFKLSQPTLGYLK